MAFLIETVDVEPDVDLTLAGDSESSKSVISATVGASTKLATILESPRSLNVYSSSIESVVPLSVFQPRNTYPSFAVAFNVTTLFRGSVSIVYSLSGIGVAIGAAVGAGATLLAAKGVIF